MFKDAVTECFMPCFKYSVSNVNLFPAGGSVSSMQPDGQGLPPETVTEDEEYLAAEEQQIEDTKDVKGQTKPEALWMDFDVFTKCFK